MSKASRVILFVAAGAALSGVGVLLVVADRALARRGRIAAAAQKDEMLSVRDQVLRYELDRGDLPERLDDLVPRYLREDQIESADEPVYDYSPGERSLAPAEPVPVRGLVPRRVEPERIELPPPEPPAPSPLPVNASEAGDFAAPVGPELAEPPAGGFVFEAEHYTETNYGWEVHPDGACSGGAYIHCKEGTGNGPGQLNLGVGDFYNVGDVRELTRLRYHFRLPSAGTFHVYGRMWTTETHCSNRLQVAVDKEGPDAGGMGNRTPFRWAWSPMDRNPVELPAGDHFLHVFMHEDGIRVDQFILSPETVKGGTSYRANLLPGRGTAWENSAGPAAHVSFDLKTAVLSPGAPPECRVVLRRLRPAKGRATARVALRGAAEGGGDLLLAERQIDLAALPEVCFMQIDFGALDVEKLARREYLLVAELVLAGEIVASTHFPLMRPFAWEAYGPVEYLPNTRAGPLDGTGGETGAWRPFADSSFSCFGVHDFGLFSTGNSLHAPQRKTIYLRTRIHVPEADTYLFKIQSDDQMIFWLDGRELCRHDKCAWRPVTRTAIRLPVELNAGEHRIRMRVNQGEGRWQACLRIRTRDDRLSAVRGLLPSKR